MTHFAVSLSSASGQIGMSLHIMHSNMYIHPHSRILKQQTSFAFSCSFCILFIYTTDIPQDFPFAIHILPHINKNLLTKRLCIFIIKSTQLIV